MRAALLIIAALSPPAWPCQPHPPPEMELTLITSPDATLPLDGAILVKRHEATHHAGPISRSFTIVDGRGRAVGIDIDALGGGLERWVPRAPTVRDLVIRDQSGTKIATLHQNREKPAALASPSVQRVTTTAELRSSPVPGIPGGTATFVLDADPPPDARLAIFVTGRYSRAHAVVEPASGQREVSTEAPASKGCGRVTISPIYVDEDVSLTWVDNRGRRSKPTTIKAVQATP